VPFLTQAAFLEEHAKADPSLDPEMVEVIIDALRAGEDLRSYFFRIGPHVGWIPIIWERGFLSTPPEPTKNADGFTLPRWEAQECLILAARDVPDIVVKHVNSIEGHPIYFERALVGLRNISGEQIEEGLPTVFKWLENAQVARWIALECMELLKKLAIVRRDAAAFDLLRKITKPFLPIGGVRDDILARVGADTILPVDEYHSRVFWKILGLFQELDPLRTIAILDEQLRETLRIEAEAINDEDYQNRSFWRNTIEDSGQDSIPEYKDVLLVGLRNSMEGWVEADTELASRKVEGYLKDSFEIFRRLGLHVIQRFPQKFQSLVETELLQGDNIDDVGIHHEYFMLLREGYSHLSTAGREELLKRILSGPTDQKKADVAEWAGKDETNVSEYVGSYSRRWVRDRLWMIREHLAGRAKEELDRLLSQSGQPDHPDYTHWMSGGFAISDVSPATEQELSTKEPREFVSYLKNWKPNPQAAFGPEQESHGALAQQAAKVVFANLPAYQEHLLEIALIRPAYATSLLRGDPENEIDLKLLWDLRLTICERLLSDEHIRTDMESSLEESGWVSFRRASIAIIKKVVEKDDESFPPEFLPRMRDLLFLLVEDPDPTLETDRPTEGYFGHEDPLTVAINHNRSEALDALIQYSRKIANRQEGRKPFGYAGIEQAVRETLSRKVKRENEPSLAVHSVFGRELNLLFWLDREWVMSHVDDIFPVGNDEESIAFYVAAWDSFVLSPVYFEILTFLRPKYEQAIENVSKGYITKSHLRPVEHLANHLLVEYFEASYDVRSPEGQKSLIGQFFQKTGSESRAQGAWRLSQICGQRRGEIEKLWPRAKQLWQWRVDVASAAGHSTDFIGEMGGFSGLLQNAPDSETIVSLWPLLEGFLPYIDRSKNFDRVWHHIQEYLAKKVSLEPLRVIQYYTLMHSQLLGPVMYYADEAKKILEEAAADKDARDDALRLIDKIARSGNRQFAYIFDKHTT